MRHIYQRCESDCFPTCIAIVTGISHRLAVELVHPSHQKGEEYATSDDQAIRVLNFLGYEVKKRNFKSIQNIKTPAILVLHFENVREEDDHVVVWDPVEKKILEPYRGYKTIPMYQYEKAFRYALLISS